jgi:hypothetical protein
MFHVLATREVEKSGSVFKRKLYATSKRLRVPDLGYFDFKAQVLLLPRGGLLTPLF